MGYQPSRKPESTSRIILRRARRYRVTKHLVEALVLLAVLWWLFH